MSYNAVEYMRKQIKRMGPWAGVRWMRNQHLPFESAYFVMFGRFPTR